MRAVPSSARPVDEAKTGFGRGGERDSSYLCRSAREGFSAIDASRRSADRAFAARDFARQVERCAKFAMTFSASFAVKVQVKRVPSHAPPEPTKTLPEAARRSAKLRALIVAPPHLLPQLINLSADEIVPLPVLVMETDGTLTFAAVICAAMNSPNSPSPGALHVKSAHNASCVVGS